MSKWAEELRYLASVNMETYRVKISEICRSTYVTVAETPRVLCRGGHKEPWSLPLSG